MINLLPQKEKQQLIFQKNRNLIVVLGSVTIIFLICLSLVFLAMKFYILQVLSLEKSNLNENKIQYQTPQYASVLDSLNRYNSLLERSDIFYKKENYLFEILDVIFAAQRPKGVTFNNVTLEKVGTTNKTKVAVDGFSLTRDELIAFQNSIRGQSNISNVNLPASNLVKPSNVNFSITFEFQHN